MKLGVDDIRAFVAVSESLAFKSAAERLGITSSALTQRIQKLEELLGARLLDRSTRNVELTELGRLFLPEARRIVHEFEGSLSRIQDVIARRSGLVSFACLLTVAYGLMPAILSRFRADFPGIRVRVFDDTALRVADHLALGQVEFGIDMARDPDPDFAFEPVVTEPYVVACAPDHEIARTRAVSWDALVSSDYVAFGLDSGIGRQLEAPQRKAHSRFEVQHLGTMIALIQSGFGIGVVPYSAIHEHGALTFRPISDPPVARTIGIIRRKGATLSPAAESLREIAITVIAAAFAELPAASLHVSDLQH